MNWFINHFAMWLTTPHSLTMQGWEWIFLIPLGLLVSLIIGGWLISLVLSSSLRGMF